MEITNDKNATGVQIFKNPTFGQIRTSMTESGEPLFCLADVCRALDLQQVSKVRTRLYTKGVHTIPLLTNGGIQQAYFITEPNLYKCIFQSRKKEAEQFQDWVCSEVLPAIRKTGGYMVTKGDETPEQIMARALLVAQQTIERSKQQLQMAQGTIEQQQDQIAAMKSKADYVDDVLQSTATYTFTQIAHSLGFRSVHVLTKELAARKLIFKQSGMWQPTARVADKGYFTTRTAKFIHSSDNSIGTSLSTVITEAGRMFIHSIFSQEKGGAR